MLLPNNQVSPRKCINDAALARAGAFMQLQYSAATVQNNRLQPTDSHLVWGRKQDRLDNRFRARSVIVEHLISYWTEPDWSGVDVSGGAGRWLSTLAPNFRQFTHLDLSSDALNVARADHAELSKVEFGIVDLLQPREQGEAVFGRTWDVVFCLDTLLYRGDFVEMVLRNIRGFICPGGIAIIDVPMQLRASISHRIKGQRYDGPERTFTPQLARALVSAAGYECLATAFQYRELTSAPHRFLVKRGLTSRVPWPGTWMYLVLRVADLT